MQRPRRNRSLRPEVYTAFANYLVKTIQGYQAAGVPVWALSVQNEPLYAPPTYSGMKMEAAEQAKFFGDALGPALAAAHLTPKVMAYDHNWDRPDYPETVLKDPEGRRAGCGNGVAPLWRRPIGDDEESRGVSAEGPVGDGVERRNLADRQRAGGRSR